MEEIFCPMCTILVNIISDPNSVWLQTQTFQAIQYFSFSLEFRIQNNIKKYIKFRKYKNIKVKIIYNQYFKDYKKIKIGNN